MREDQESARGDGSTVLLSDAQDAARLAAELSASGRAACYGSVAELVEQRPLSSVSVLVVAFRPQPKGILLAALGRMSLEYPAMQKVVVVDEPPPLAIVEYLTACGVDVLWESAEDQGKLASTIRRLHERTPWIAA